MAFEVCLLTASVFLLSLLTSISPLYFPTGRRWIAEFRKQFINSLSHCLQNPLGNHKMGVCFISDRMWQWHFAITTLKHATCQLSALLAKRRAELECKQELCPSRSFLYYPIFILKYRSNVLYLSSLCPLMTCHYIKKKKRLKALPWSQGPV